MIDKLNENKNLIISVFLVILFFGLWVTQLNKSADILSEAKAELMKESQVEILVKELKDKISLINDLDIEKSKLLDALENTETEWRYNVLYKKCLETAMREHPKLYPSEI